MTHLPTPLNHTLSQNNSIILPANHTELEKRARDNDLVNSYRSVSFDGISWHLDRTKENLIKSLLDGSKTIDDPDVQYNILLTKSALQAILETDITDIMKKELYHNILTGHSPWMYPSIVGNIIKKIDLEEIHPGQTVSIKTLDFDGIVSGRKLKIGGTSIIRKPRSPLEIYNTYIANNTTYSPLEKKLIAYALDRKPYRSNEILTMSALQSIDIDREEGEIHFKGKQSWDLGYSLHFFTVMHFGLSTPEQRKEKDILLRNIMIDKEHYKYDPILLRQMLEKSTWNDIFVPDFLANK